jgi:hypothetical protein
MNKTSLIKTLTIRLFEKFTMKEAAILILLLMPLYAQAVFKVDSFGVVKGVPIAGNNYYCDDTSTHPENVQYMSANFIKLFAKEYPSKASIIESIDTNACYVNQSKMFNRLFTLISFYTDTTLSSFCMKGLCKGYDGGASMTLSMYDNTKWTGVFRDGPTTDDFSYICMDIANKTYAALHCSELK